jgi:HlyD family secretion protein
MKRFLLTVVVLGAIAVGAGAYYNYSRTPLEPVISTASVTAGNVVDSVGATGTLQAVTTVQVGSQVSGIIQELHADFNSLVRKGQVIARLEPSLFETQIEQARANLIRAEADLERLRVTLEDARTKLKRAQDLSARQLIPQSELETAEVTVRSTEAQIRSSEAQVTQAQASLNQNQVNLEHTVIAAPIDGIVVSRSVDVGQTVAASMQAPVLFLLAADLADMQVIANIDESDVGRIRPGQRVSFRVDAYPAEDFVGTVTQVRLEPIIEQNVVTYATVIDVPNPELKLKPGMTANVNIEVASAMNTLRVPNAALRFRPTDDIFAALGQLPPGEREDARRGSGAPSNAVASGVAAPDSGAPGPQVAEGGGRRGGRGGGRGNFAERLQNMSPEEREQALERMRARGFDPTAVGGGGDRGGATRGGNGGGRASAAATVRDPEATTIDALFGPLAPVESTGRVWVMEAGELRPIRVRLGVTDGSATALIEGDLEAGDDLVTNISTGTEAASTPNAGGIANPFAQPQRGRGRGGFRGF